MEQNFTEEEIQKHIDIINNMTHYDMAHLYRFGEIGHIYFNIKLPFWEHFAKRFYDEFGGMTTEISKKMDWSR